MWTKITRQALAQNVAKKNGKSRNLPIFGIYKGGNSSKGNSMIESWTIFYLPLPSEAVIEIPKRSTSKRIIFKIM